MFQRIMDFWRGLKPSFQWAAGIAIVVVLWVVSGQIFVTDLSKKKEMDAAWTEFFGDDLPVRATVGVNDLGGSALIEIVVTAVKG